MADGAPRSFHGAAAVDVAGSADVPGARRVAVIGGGVAGLVAARRLAGAGCSTVVFEAGGRVGGQVHTRSVAGVPVDVGAESLLLSAPPVRGLIETLGLGEGLVSARSWPTWIRRGRRLRRLPAGVGPAGPTRLRPLVRAGILSPRGLLRAGVEPLVPRGSDRADPSVGALLTRRFGRQVVERLVDPLLGSLHAADVDRLSAAAVAPTLLTRLKRSGSLLRTARSAPPGPEFATLHGGLVGLVERLADEPGLRLRLSTPVRAIVATPAGYRLDGEHGPLTEVDAVVLATPAAATRHLLAGLVPDAAALLEHATAAGVATVVAAYPATQRTAVPDVNGLLVPSTSGLLLKAATFLSNKWPHLSDAPAWLVRLSAGRSDDQRFAGLDDDELVARLHRELAATVGLSEPPIEVIVQRWPATMPQLEVGHLQRVGELRRALAAHPRIRLAGAAFDGVGIHAAITSGNDVADGLLHDLLTEQGAT